MFHKDWAGASCKIKPPTDNLKTIAINFFNRQGHKICLMHNISWQILMDLSNSPSLLNVISVFCFVQARGWILLKEFEFVPGLDEITFDSKRPSYATRNKLYNRSYGDELKAPFLSRASLKLLLKFKRMRQKHVMAAIAYCYRQTCVHQQNLKRP